MIKPKRSRYNFSAATATLPKAIDSPRAYTQKRNKCDTGWNEADERTNGKITEAEQRTDTGGQTVQVETSVGKKWKRRGGSDNDGEVVPRCIGQALVGSFDSRS